MMLIVYYVIFMSAGLFADYFIGLFVEREFGSQVSLLVFLGLYLVILWLSWLLSVWMTEPKRNVSRRPSGGRPLQEMHCAA